MNKDELKRVLAGKTGLTHERANDAIDAVVEIISSELAARRKVSIQGFGTFEAVRRAARKGSNPATGEPMTIPARTVPKFKPGKTLKDRLSAS